MQLGGLEKNKSCHHPSQNVDCCGPLSNAKSREGKRSMKNFSLFIARDSISFCFARSVTTSLPSGTCTLNQGSSVHFSRNRKWKVFHSERGFRYFFVVQFKCFTQSVLQTEKVSFYNIAREASYGLWPLMTSVASNSLSDIKWEHLRLRPFEAIRIY